MSGYIIHIPLLGEQNIDIAKIGIPDNFWYAILAQPHHLPDRILRPAKAA